MPGEVRGDGRGSEPEATPNRLLAATSVEAGGSGCGPHSHTQAVGLLFLTRREVAGSQECENLGLEHGLGQLLELSAHVESKPSFVFVIKM